MGSSQGGADISVPLIRQDVQTCECNNTITPLNAGLTWTGTAHTTLGVAGIQVNIFSDTDCTVYVDQSMNGSDWDIVDSYLYYHTLGGSSWTVQATASFLRVRVTNTTATNQTILRVQTALCPIVEALPRSLSTLGNLKVSTQEFISTFGSSVQASPMNALKVMEPTRLVGTTFSGTTLATNFWTKTTVVGTGDITLATGQATLTTGATANSSIIVNSNRVGRYTAGASNFYRAVVRAPAIVGENVRRWGAFDANNGFFFETDGTTLSLVCRKGASDVNKVSSGSFNGTVYGNIYAIGTTVNTYEIHWTNSKAWFMVNGTIIHTFSGSTAPLCDTMHLKVGMSNTNSGGNTNVNLLEIRVSSIYGYGKLNTLPNWIHQAGAIGATLLKSGPGTLQRVVLNDTGGTSVTLYDDTNTGAPTNPICIIDPTSAQTSLEYNLPFFNGLMYTTVGSTDITIVYE